jgi:hypothetical protein
MSDSELDPTRVDQPVVSPDPTLVGQPAVPMDQGGGPPTGGMPPVGAVPPPPDRRPWIIAALLALIVAILIVILLLQDDDDDEAADATSTTSSLETTTSTTSASSSTTTSTTEAPTTTEEPGVTVPPEDCADNGQNEATPGLVADIVFDAWVRGDEACAAELMTPSALAELFSRDGEGATDDFQGCTESQDPGHDADCAFTYEGGSTHYLMDFTDPDGWKVVEVEQIAD